MIRSEIDTIDLELKIATSPEKKAAWADKWGTDLVGGLLEALSEESERVDSLESEVGTLEEENALLSTSLEEAKELASDLAAKVKEVADKIEELQGK